MGGPAVVHVQGPPKGCLPPPAAACRRLPAFSSLCVNHCQCSSRTVYSLQEHATQANRYNARQALHTKQASNCDETSSHPLFLLPGC